MDDGELAHPAFADDDQGGPGRFRDGAVLVGAGTGVPGGDHGDLAVAGGLDLVQAEASNASLNLLSRSRIRNLNRAARPPRSIRRLRACWAVHTPVRCAVTPRTRTRRGGLANTT